MYEWLKAQLTPARVAHAFFDGEGGASGGEAAQGDAPPPAQAPAGDAPETRGGVPVDRFREVNRELQELKAANAQRDAEEARKRGDHEKLANAATAERDEARATAARALRSSAFALAAAGKVADVSAAAKLALSDGMLDDLKVDLATGDVEGDAGEVVAKLLKAYPFLTAEKIAKPPTGAPVGGAGAGGRDPSKMTPEEKIAVGLEQQVGQLPATRRGLVGANGAR
jgi:hypothetical protein